MISVKGIAQSIAGYPMPVFHFSVKWGGVNGSFSEVSGLKVETQLLEYRDGLSPEFFTTKMPGMQKNSTISMKRGMLQSDSDFSKWWDTVSLNKVERRDLIISLLNEFHVPTVTWKVKKAWPLKMEGPSLKATGNEIAIESIELAHEGITMEHHKRYT